MNISDDTLMAYADGELAPQERAAVESAMRADPQLLERVDQHRRLRQKLQDAFAAELSEPVPERLHAALSRQPPVAEIIPLASRRTGAARAWQRPSVWRWGGALAASVLIGLTIGVRMTRDVGLIGLGTGGELAARGALASALSEQLSGEAPSSAAAQVALSFRASSGEYCRVFALRGAAPLSGLACREGAQWRIDALDRDTPGSHAGTDYRTAASALNPAILKLVESRISGEAFDQAAERSARQADWQR